jgi:hypothetical protein
MGFFNSNSGLEGGVQLGPLGTAAINRPIVPTPCVYDDGEICGMMVGRGNRSTLRKSAPVPLWLPQTSHALPGREPGPRSGNSCIPPPPLSSLYQTWYVYHATWAHLNGVHHKSLAINLCVCICIPISLVGNGSVNTLSRQRIHTLQ